MADGTVTQTKEWAQQAHWIDMRLVGAKRLHGDARKDRSAAIDRQSAQLLEQVDHALELMSSGARDEPEDGLEA